MKLIIASVFFLALSHPGYCADEPTVDLDLLVDGSVINSATHTASGFLSKTESYTLQLKEKPVGAAIGVAHIWSETLTKNTSIANHSLEVQVKVTKTEGSDGRVSWWAQVTFGNQIAAGLGGADLSGLRLLANGAPQTVTENITLEPRAIVDFK